MNRKAVVDGKRECLRCHLPKPLAEFALRKSGHFRSCCSGCESQRTAEYGRILKKKAVDYLGGACQICGYSRSLRALSFHHKDPSQKEFSLGKRKLVKWETAKQELDKCALLCANCHAEVHDGLVALK